jgi:ferredoxin-NADP reductase
MPTAMETTMKDQPDAQTLTMPDAQTVTEVKHYTDRLFSFRVTRPRSLRFRSGEFVMIGLPGDDGKPILRAYSIASPAWDEELEFYSIKVQDGPLTSRLQHIQPGDQIILKTKAVGTLVLDALLPGQHLWFFATGTGIAPFASLIRDPDTYERYDRVILAHTTRLAAELTYGHELLQRTFDDPLVGEMAAEKLTYFPARPHARGLPRDGAHHPQARIGRAVRETRRRSDHPRGRPGHGLRVDGPQPRHDEDPRRLRSERRRQFRPARICGRTGVCRIAAGARHARARSRSTATGRRHPPHLP